MASRNRGMAAPDRRRAKIWPTIQARRPRGTALGAVHRTHERICVRLVELVTTARPSPRRRGPRAASRRPSPCARRGHWPGRTEPSGQNAPPPAWTRAGSASPRLNLDRQMNCVEGSGVWTRKVLPELGEWVFRGTDQRSLREALSRPSPPTGSPLALRASTRTIWCRTRGWCRCWDWSGRGDDPLAATNAIAHARPPAGGRGRVCRGRCSSIDRSSAGRAWIGW